MSNTINNVFDLLAHAIEEANEKRASEKANADKKAKDETKTVKEIKIDFDNFEDLATGFLNAVFDVVLENQNDNRSDNGTVEDFKEPDCNNCSECGKCNMNKSGNKNEPKQEQDEDKPEPDSIRDKLLKEIAVEIENENAKLVKLEKANKLCDYVESVLKETGPDKKYKIIRGTRSIPHSVEVKIPLDIASYYDLNNMGTINHIKKEIIKKTDVADVYIQRDDSTGTKNGIVIYMPLNG